MRILLIYKEEEKSRAETFILQLENMKIQVDHFPINSALETRESFEKQFAVFFTPSVLDDGTLDKRVQKLTHIAVLSALAPGGIDFLAGFLCGSLVPCLVYGEDAIQCIPKVFAFCFKPLNTEAEMLKFLKSEYENFKLISAEKGINWARETLLKMGVPINEKSLARCVDEGSLAEVLFFLAAGFSPNTRSETGVPLLCIAARKGNREITRFLILADADVNLLANDRGTSALLDSVMGKYFELAMDHIKAGADINIQSTSGQTALVIAVGAGDDRMVEALLKAGADPDIKDSMGVSARKYAALFSRTNMLALFDTRVPRETV